MPFPQPKPGPLQTTEHLICGDMVRCIDPLEGAVSTDQICHIKTVLDDAGIRIYEWDGMLCIDRFFFVGRPEHGGWMDWPGGENPCPGRWVEAVLSNGVSGINKSEDYYWHHTPEEPRADIVRFRLVGMPAQRDFIVAPEKVPDLRPEELRGNTVEVDVNDLRAVCHKLRLLASEGAPLVYSQRMALERLEASVGRLEASPDLPPSTEFQSRVADWMYRCFGNDITNSAQERCWRFAEEAGELVQTLGMTQQQWTEIGEYVWKRAVGETPQEIGGVMVTLAALSHAVHLSMSGCGEVELARIDTPAMIAKIRQKHHDKVLRIPTSPLPGADQ